MIRCLLFGHEPHPTYEPWRIGVGNVMRGFSFCTRCSVIVTVEARGGFPNQTPLTSDERDAVLIDSLIERLMPELKVALLPHLLKRKRAVRRSPALTETET